MVRTTLIGAMSGAVITAAALFAAPPAWATGGLYCDGVTDKDVSIALTIGRVPGFAVVGALVTTKTKTWVMNHTAKGAPIAMAQGAVLSPWIVADFTDPNHEQILVSLRIAQMDTDDGRAAGGVLSIPGVGIWPVSCELD